MAATLVLVGTTKGLFTLRSTDGRRHFEVQGPALAGEEVYATCIDGRGSPRLLAGSVSMHWGPVIRRSVDLGATWTEEDEASIAFPADTGTALARVWQLAPGSASEPDVMYAGVEPAALFRSDDGGRTFALVRGLWDHPHRPQWEPGGGGLCLHTVLVHPTDPARLLVAISAAGVYRSDDAGGTWCASNIGIVAGFLPDAPTPEFGQCVHKVARDAGDPERLYLQHHDGIYRSDDGGGAWLPMEPIGGVDFGFPVVAHPTLPDTAYLLPLEGAEYRCTPGGRCTVWRTNDAGTSWSPQTIGLPQADAHLTVLRDGFTTDGDEPAGLYFGTRSGEIYGSADDGDSWQLVAAHLPPVLSIRAARRWADGDDVDVKVRVPTALRDLTDGRSSFAIDLRDGATVADLLDSIAAANPALERRIRDESGTLRTHVNLFVGDENVRALSGAHTVLPAGAEVSILAAISGG